MAGPIALVNPTVVINNVSVPIVPNSFSYTEGLGEQKMRVQSAGGGSVQSVLSNDVETNLSKIEFEMYPTSDNIDLILSWKQNSNNNGISVSGEGLTRSFGNAALTSDYKVALGSDTKIPVEFHSDAAV